MKTYQQVLIATDLSKEAKKVADRGASIAKKSGAKLTMLHIIELNPTEYGSGEFAINLESDPEQSLQQESKQLLKKEGKRLGIPENNQRVELGSTPEELVKIINEMKVDLLVLGSHDPTGLSFLFSSKANSLLHLMPCDVLAVHIPS